MSNNEWARCGDNRSFRGGGGSILTHLVAKTQTDVLRNSLRKTRCLVGRGGGPVTLGCAGLLQEEARFRFVHLGDDGRRFPIRSLEVPSLEGDLVLRDSVLESQLGGGWRWETVLEVGGAILGREGERRGVVGVA